MYGAMNEFSHVTMIRSQNCVDTETTQLDLTLDSSSWLGRGVKEQLTQHTVL